MLTKGDLLLVYNTLVVILILTNLDSSWFEYPTGPAGRLEEGAQCMQFTTWAWSEPAGAESSVNHYSSSRTCRDNVGNEVIPCAAKVFVFEPVLCVPRREIHREQGNRMTSSETDHGEYRNGHDTDD